MRDDRERLIDILEAIERIEKYSSIEKSSFESDELIQTWMVYNIQIIGEAASKLTEDFRLQHSNVPWRAIASMRNVIVPAYFQVDLDEVWNAVHDDLPVLKQQISPIIKETTT